MITINNDNDINEDNKNDNASDKHNDDYPIIDNCMVEVLPRTWPGSNKIGGIARVTKCHFITQSSLNQADDPNSNDSLNINDKTGDKGGGDGGPSHIDVRYVVMGGREKMVPMEYCRPAPQYDHNISHRRGTATSASTATGAKFPPGENSAIGTNDETGHNSIMQGSMQKRTRLILRDRSSLLGRCKLCGSLRNDCGSCDWIQEERNRREYQDKMTQSDIDLKSSRIKNSKVKRGKRTRQKQIKSILLADDSDSSDDADEDGNDDHDAYSSSSDESFVLRGRRNPTFTRQRQVFSSSSDEDGSSTDDEVLAKLKVLPTRNRKADSKKKKKKKLMAKFRASNRIFKARMQFLNECLKSGKKPAARKKNETNDTRLNDASVLENIGSSWIASESGSSEKGGIEIQDDLKEGRTIDRDKDVFTDAVEGSRYCSKRQNRKVPIPSFKAVDDSIGSDNDDDDDIEFHHSHNTSEQIDASVLDSAALDRDGTDENDASAAYSECNDPMNAVERRVGYVDGDDIGEKEIDEEREERAHMDLDGSCIAQFKPYSIQNQIEDLRGYYEDKPELDTFIQPEGDDFADNLPSDLVDSSILLPFASLPKFFDKIQVDLSDFQIPKFQLATLQLEKFLETAHNQVDRSLSKKQMLDIERKCRKLYDEMCVDLVRDGTDQCRCALKRFGKRREFRQEVHQLSKQQWRALVENLDLRFDGLDKLVEDSLRRARNLLLDCSDRNGFNIDEEVKSRSTSDVDSNQDYADDRELVSSDHLSSFSPDSERHAYAIKSRNSYRMQSSKSTLEKSHDFSVQPRRKRRNNNDGPRTRQTKQRRRMQLSRDTNEGRHDEADKYNISNGKDLEFDANQNVSGGSSIIGHRSRSTRGESNTFRTSSGRTSAPNPNKVHGRETGTNQSGRKRLFSLAPYHEAGSAQNIQEYNDDDAEDRDDMGIDINAENIFESLSSSASRPASQHQSLNTTRRDVLSVQQICETISTDFPGSYSNTLLKELPSYFDPNILPSDSLHSMSVMVLSTLLNLLRKSGNHSLQEMIAMKCQTFLSHVRLMCCVFGLLRRKVNLNLKPSDGIVHTVFSGKNLSTSVICQMIDVLYANLLPEEWGTSKKMDSSCYELLGNLRDELCGSIHVVEEFSLCILKFPCQRWYKSTLTSKEIVPWYVSSIEPKTLELFWQGDAAISSVKGDVRLGRLKNNCPRKEIDALWWMLAWFSKAGSSETVSNIRWRLIITQFTYHTGSLGQHRTATGVLAPPSRAQMECCREEIYKFSLLLRSSALDPMPSDDGLFMKLLLKSITLCAEDPESRSILNMSRPPSKHDRKIAFKVWQESDLSYLVQRDNLKSDALSKRLLIDLAESNEQSSSLFSLVPDETLTVILHLLKDWLRRIPNTKARWSRLGDALNGLVSKLFADSQVRNVNKDSHAKIDDDFAQCFSNVNIASSEMMGGDRQLSRCHAIVLVIGTVLWSRSESGIEADPNFSLRIDLRLCEKIWQIVADNRIKSIHEQLLASDQIIYDAAQCESLDSAAQNIMKIFSTLILSYLDIFDRENIHCEDSADEKCLVFMFTCILSYLFVTCERLGYSASSAPFRQPPLLSSARDGAGDANVLSSGLLWLTCIVEKANTILYRKAMENYSRISKLQNVFDYFIPRALRVSANCLKTIPSCVGEVATLGTSYRLALSLFRGTTHSFLIRHQFQCISASDISFMRDNNRSPDDNTQTHSGENESEDLFGGIDDDALMAIDLDNIVETSTHAVEAKKSPCIDDLGYRHVWKLLSDSLRAAKPSTRYTISNIHAISNANQFTNTGKAICAAHAGGICALIASICSIQEPNAANERNLRLLIESFLPRNGPSSIDETNSSFDNDDEFLNDLRQCFCSELCHVAKFGKNCMVMINTLADDIILRAFLSAITNASVLNAFPSINRQLLLKIGGVGSRDKEDRSLVKALEKLETRPNNHPDADGHSVLKHMDGYTDTPSNYMTSHLWSFCEDLGLVLQSIAKDKPPSESNILLMLSSSCICDDSTIISSDVLKALPRSTLERECLKRVILLKSILESCFNMYPRLNTELSKIKLSEVTQTILSAVISGFLLQASCLMKGVEYYEKTPSSCQPYIRAKSQALFTAYSDVMSSVLSWLLLPKTKEFVSEQIGFVYHYIVLPILSNKGLQTARASIYEGSGNSAKTRILEFEGGMPHAGVAAELTTSKILLNSFYCHIRDVVQYAGSEDGDHHFYEVMSCIQSVNNTFLRQNFSLPAAFLEGREFYKPRDQFELGDYIELHYKHSSSAHLANTCSRFRSFAIRSFLLPKIKHRTIDSKKKVTMLLVLLLILDVKRIQRQYRWAEPILISVGGDRLGNYLHIRYDIEAIIESIYICIDNGITHPRMMTSSLMRYCFVSLKCILTMNVKESDPSGSYDTPKELLGWCDASKGENETALMVYLYMELMLTLSKILRSYQSAVLIEQHRRPKESIAAASTSSNDVSKFNAMILNIDAIRNHSLAAQQGPSLQVNLYLNQSNEDRAEGCDNQGAIGSTSFTLDENAMKALLEFQEAFSKGLNK